MSQQPTSPSSDTLANAPPGAPADLATYGAGPGGQGWGTDTLESLRASRRIAWTVAAGAGGLALIQAVAILVMLPLKQTVPYTITVDRNTGWVQAARGVNLGPMSESEAVAKASLVNYVLARETFDVADFRENYRRTLLWSTATARSAYLADWDRDNPNAVQNRYRPSTRVEVTVKDVTLTSPTTAVVSFDTVQTEGPGSSGQRNAYQAAVTFGFSGAPLNEQTRYLNPLGFQVSTYRRDTQTYQPAFVPAPPPPPAPPPVAALPMAPLPGDGTAAGSAGSAAPPGAAPGAATGPSGPAATPGTGAPPVGLTPEPASSGAGVPGVDPGVAP
jgi:type IV secretion system protein VirB8